MHADANADYGGFAAMVKNGAYEDLQLTQRNATTWDFKFEQTIAGKKNLMSKLPLDRARRVHDRDRQADERRDGARRRVVSQGAVGRVEPGDRAARRQKETLTLDDSRRRQVERRLVGLQAPVRGRRAHRSTSTSATTTTPRPRTSPTPRRSTSWLVDRGFQLAGELVRQVHAHERPAHAHARRRRQAA